LTTINKQEFWDNKILVWERDKYAPTGGFLGRFGDVNRSLKKRMQIAEEAISRISANRILLEIGCGSARLLPEVMQAGAAKYIGVDISKVAIEQARARANELGVTDKTEFYHLDATNLDELQPDICFSLGLLDWLDIDEIRNLLSSISCQYFFHSYSEKRWSIQQIFHRLYIFFMYGHRTSSYIPKYYTQNQLNEIFTACYGVQLQFFRSSELSFGSFIFHLPEGIELGNE